ncbi:MAG: hypothetical protein AAGF45_05175, partial [Pseudomonadota bacterium]
MSLALERSAEAPPPVDGGFLAWARRRLFANTLDTIVTLTFGALTLWLAVTLINWAFVGAVWDATNAEACRDSTGACWAVIDARGRLILFGLYPYEQQWRSLLACLVVRRDKGRTGSAGRGHRSRPSTHPLSRGTPRRWWRPTRR